MIGYGFVVIFCTNVFQRSYFSVAQLPEYNKKKNADGHINIIILELLGGLYCQEPGLPDGAFCLEFLFVYLKLFKVFVHFFFGNYIIKKKYNNKIDAQIKNY